MIYEVNYILRLRIHPRVKYQFTPKEFGNARPTSNRIGCENMSLNMWAKVSTIRGIHSETTPANYLENKTQVLAVNYHGSGDTWNSA